MSLYEWIASIFLLACVWLSTKQNIWTWPLGIIGVSIFFFIFYHAQLYADMWLQVVFILQSIYGWYYWSSRKGDADGKTPVGQVNEVPIRKLKFLEQGFILISILILTGIIGYVSDHYSDTDVPYLDAVLASMSLIANILLARKIIDNWLLWIIADVMYIGLFYYKGLYVTSGLYLIFLGMAMSGLFQWRKEWQLQEA